MEIGGKRFASSTLEDRKKIVEDAVPVSTKKVTSTWVAALVSYAADKEKERLGAAAGRVLCRY